MTTLVRFINERGETCTEALHGRWRDRAGIRRELELMGNSVEVIFAVDFISIDDDPYPDLEMPKDNVSFMGEDE